MFAAWLAACGGSGGGGDGCEGDACVNECELGTHDCDSNAACTDTDEAFTCECADGYDGDGRSCSDIDECAEGLAECSPIGTCANTEGSYECGCPDGLLDYGGQCVKASAGTYHACLIRDGALSCWGGNYNGQLGQSDYDSRGSLTGIDGTWIDVDAGESSTCAVRKDGTLYCWGYDSDAGDRLEPFQVGTDDGWARVSVGTEHMCALDGEGRLYCWGYDDYGQVGNGMDDTDYYALPQQVGTDSDWTDVAATYYSTCAVAADGALYCWGEDGNGALGDGDDDGSEAHLPQVVPGLASVTGVTGADSVETFCAIESEGSTHCWGYNNDGQVGNLSTGAVESPYALSGVFAAVGVGATTCAIDGDGGIHCWGDNRYGQRAEGDRDEDLVGPTEVDSDLSWLSVEGGGEFMCGLADTGDGKATLHCWGNNEGGALALGLSDDVREPAVVSGAWRAVAAGGNRTCAIRADDSLWCWGENQNNALGVASDNEFEQVPQPLSPGKAWQSLSSGDHHSCAIDSDDGLYCWGNNANGSLGLGDFEPRATPVQVGTDGDWAQVSAGGATSCGVRGTPASLYCWGANTYGQLGTGDQDARESPVDVGDVSQDGDEGWIQVAVGASHTCGHLEEPTPTGSQFAAYCWGRNNVGQVGNASDGDPVLNPDRIDVDQEWVLASGGFHTCGINDSNDLLCWGANNFGQLGLDDTTPRDVPVQSTEIANWSAIAGGDYHACGLAPVAGGTALYCHGRNQWGQLGLGSLDNENLPVRVGTAANWTQVSAGAAHSCAINSDGQLFCWGRNSDGQLGTGTTFRSEPAAIDE